MVLAVQDVMSSSCFETKSFGEPLPGKCRKVAEGFDAPQREHVLIQVEEAGVGAEGGD